jgi:hypothetical protein
MNAHPLFIWQVTANTSVDSHRVEAAPNVWRFAAREL